MNMIQIAACLGLCNAPTCCTIALVHVQDLLLIVRLVFPHHSSSGPLSLMGCDQISLLFSTQWVFISQLPRCSIQYVAYVQLAVHVFLVKCLLTKKGASCPLCSKPSKPDQQRNLHDPTLGQAKINLSVYADSLIANQYTVETSHTEAVWNICDVGLSELQSDQSTSSVSWDWMGLD